MAKRQKKQGSGGGTGWIWYVLLITIGLVISPGACLVFAVGMAPTMVATIGLSGPSSGQRLLTMACFNFAGVLPFIINVFNGDDTSGSVLSDVFSWGVMMSAAGAGAMVNYVGPVIAAQVLTNMSVADQHMIDKARKKLIDEWGESVTK